MSESSQLNATLRSNLHGQIKCGTISVSNMQSALDRYTGFLAQQIVEESEIDLGLAEAWGVPAMAGCKTALLKPNASDSSYLRLVELPEYPRFEPARTFGWSAFEISVKNVFELATALQSSDFDIVGPPKHVDGFTSFIPMQVIGPDNEILFLNQVVHSEEDVDLPLAESEVDRLFIAVLASADREAAVKSYVADLDMDEKATHTFRYSLINRSFGFPEETNQTITMIQKGRRAFAQIDQYPGQAQVRPQKNGLLPPGNSLLSVVVDDIDALPIADKLISPPQRHKGSLYEGARSAVFRGPDTELIELIEYSV